MQIDFQNIQKKGNKDRSEPYNDDKITSDSKESLQGQNLRVAFIVFGIMAVCLIVFALSREIYLLKTNQKVIRRLLSKIFKKLLSQETKIIETQQKVSNSLDVQLLQQLSDEQSDEYRVIPLNNVSKPTVVVDNIQQLPKFPDIA